MAENKDGFKTPPSERASPGPHSDEPQRDLFRVSVKVPEFWADRPDVWFAQLEAQFALARINDDTTKFYHVISQLGNQYTAEVLDVIQAPPSTGKYQKIKAELIRRLSSSQEKKIKQLLSLEELGDRTPSQFLRRIQSLAGPTVPEDFIRTMWSSRLPHNVQTIVAMHSETPLAKTAEIADKIYELAPPSPQVAAASTNHSDIPPYITEMTKQIAELTKCVAELSTRGRQNNRGQLQSRRRSSSRRRSPSGQRLCWYHWQFGDEAKKCNHPCSYKPGNASGSRQ
ncbi:uncharacterized protein LOC113229722 [Hyposmocoma kahamanoa]|uniref:uncharacterized protein LOC113229722 n=1 Tax=Hyposmocoma kahamanoa TaxID=1477025 RepID=UPI000E6D66B4|nr:uncharacterized protein LOC113229722 [Hyposmocoma kahamanoa]